MSHVKNEYDEVLSRLQLVVLDYPCYAWDEPTVKDLLHGILSIKFKGYQLVYGQKAIAADKADFVGTHLIACLREDDILKPVMAYKSITLDRCDEFFMEFPGLSLLRSDADKECYEELEKIVAYARAGNRRISFDSSWAQDPAFKMEKSADVKQLFQDLTMMLAVQYQHEFNIAEMVTCGVVKVKTDLFFEKLGMKEISSRAKFNQKNLGNEEVRAFYTNFFSSHAHDVAKKYDWLWNNKIYVNGQHYLNTEKKAA